MGARLDPPEEDEWGTVVVDAAGAAASLCSLSFDLQADVWPSALLGATRTLSRSAGDDDDDDDELPAEGCSLAMVFIYSKQLVRHHY